MVRSKAAAEALGEEAPTSTVHPGIDYPAAINVIGHAGRTFALVEGARRPTS